LARAFYRDADIILLDDPLSAVDSRVGRGLFYSAIQDLGIRRGKCVVLVTHQHQFIGDSRCIMMSGGRIACIGSYQDCVEASDGKLTFAAQHHSSNDLAKLDTISEILEANEEIKLSEAASIKGGDSKTSDGKLDDHKELRVVGEVKRTTFLNYLRAMPGGIISGILMVSRHSRILRFVNYSPNVYLYLSPLIHQDDSIYSYTSSRLGLHSNIRTVVAIACTGPIVGK
jgi:ATP-binding cassette subfamily C (CFTR/MRP) protein 4